ncbi:MAG: TatD family hydrolase [Proteobacteria bacterium]|nr:TatD family hydrolase [Pseudomonadota bacterium]
MIFDAHCHINDSPESVNIDAIIQAAIKAGLRGAMIGGVEPAEWQRQKHLQQSYPNFIFCNFGIHPWTVAKNDDDTLSDMFSKLKLDLSKVAALGECGLDFYEKGQSIEDETKQIKWLTLQMQLAMSSKKPIVLHKVKAHSQMIKALEPYNALRGIVHGWTGPEDHTQDYQKKGLLFGIGPRYLKCKAARSDKPKFSLSEFCIESDGPFKKHEIPDGQTWVDDLNRTAQFLADQFQVSRSQIWSQNAENLRKAGFDFLV